VLQKTVFDYSDYKAYLSQALEIRQSFEKGQKSKLADSMGCRPAYLSQVLNGPQDLSLEQAHAANQFFGHPPQESRYFLNLVLLSRAGTLELKKYFQSEVQKQKDERLILKNRVKSNRTLSEADQARYYSSWYYAAVHVIISIDQMNSAEHIAEAIGLPLATVKETIEFLIQMGLIKLQGKALRQGETSLYLDADSPFISKHHTNWRIRAISTLDQKDRKKLNYSGVITCSHQDAEKIQETMIQAVQKIRSIVKDSKDETLLVYALDLFSLVSVTKEGR